MSTEGTRVPPHLRVPLAGVTPAPTQKDGQKLFPTGHFRFFRPIYKDKKPPCNHGCPTGEKIQKYLDLVKHGRYLEAYATIKEDNPMPSVTGRVCYHPCESACNRQFHDAPIAIRSEERFLGDYGLALAEDVVTPGPPNGRHVAVVGAGPAGLACAYHLALRGYRVTVFEAREKPGGLLTGGIPEWHLPRAVAEKEIGRIAALGVQIKCNHRVGREIAWDDLKRFDACFLAAGQDVGKRFPIPGDDKAGVSLALDFLRDLGHGKNPWAGKRVIVIGGGNTALDTVRSALRVGGGKATMVALEGRQEMPAIEEDVLHALDEGVEIWNNGAVVEILGNGRVTGVKIAQARLVKDERGAIRPDVTPGTEVEVECDQVLFAIGQTQDLHWAPAHVQQNGIFRSDSFHRLVDAEGNPEGNFFVGGDVARGPGMVVQALGDGKEAAIAIDRWLSGLDLVPEPEPDVIHYNRLNPYYFKHAGRIEIPLSPAPVRARDQNVEVTLGINDDEAVREADRCMSCGVCNGCDNCYVVCPDVSVLRDVRENGHYEIRLEYCKGCLVCVQECPTGCLEKAPELDFEDGIIRMETAFTTHDGAHAAQAGDIDRLMQAAIAEADAARKQR